MSCFVQGGRVEFSGHMCVTHPASWPVVLCLGSPVSGPQLSPSCLIGPSQIPSSTCCGEITKGS